MKFGWEIENVTDRIFHFRNCERNLKVQKCTKIRSLMIKKKKKLLN